MGFNSGSYYTYENDDVIITLDRAPAEHIDPLLDLEKGVFIYASSDEYCHEYEFPEGVEFIQGDSRRINYESDPQQWLEKWDDGEVDIYTVGVYEHGLIDYHLSGDSIHSGCQFDYVANAGFIAIPTDFTDTREAAKCILEEYTNWCNGDVYTIVTMLLKDGDWVVDDTCSGYLGWEYTESVMMDDFKHLTKKD